ncbi:MAG: YkvI family membrane protein [Cellulosilyticaceae bacterium]
MCSKSIKRTLQIASVYIGAVIGAGFASGQEMIQFFTRYGMKGMYGLVLAGILHGAIGAILLEVAYEKKWQDYDTLLSHLMGKTLGKILKWLVNIFLFVCYSAMIAGAGAILQQQFGLPVWVGGLLMAGGCLITFLSGSKGFVRMNSLLVPVLCIGAVGLGTYMVLFKEAPVWSMSGSTGAIRNWVTSAILYVSYNTLTVMVVLVHLSGEMHAKKEGVWAGWIGGLGLGLVGLSIGACTLLYYSRISQLEIPMMGILLDYPKVFQYMYLVVLVLAMYTTAIANGYGMIENMSGKKAQHKKMMIIGISVLGLLGAKVGFSHIVAHVFPLFGYIGCFEILMLIVYYSYMKWENRRN